MPEKHGRPRVGLGGSVRARVATVGVLGLLAFSVGMVAPTVDPAAAAKAPVAVALVSSAAAPDLE